MKKSLIVRWIIIAIVLCVWIWAMFPISDKDFLSIYREKSAKTVAEIQQGAEALLQKGDPEELSRKMDAVTDKNSEEYKKLDAQAKELAGDKNIQNWRKNRDYIELTKRLDLILHKSQYEFAESIRKEMESGIDKNSQEYKNIEAKYNEITGTEDYKAWMATDEYKELIRRLPAVKMKEALDLAVDKTSPEYAKLAEEYKKLTETLAAAPKFDDPKKAEEYEQTVKRLTLVYDVDKSISGFKVLEKAANGNSELYRINLNDFVKVPFYGSVSNKLVLRYIRAQSAGKLHLGLDLKGGTEFVLDFDIREAQGLLVTPKVMHSFVAGVIEGNEAYIKILPAEMKAEIDAFAKAKKSSNADLSSLELGRALVAQKEFAGKLRSLLAENSKVLNEKDNTFGSVVEIRDRILGILDNRLNSMGVTEPEIKATGDNTISVTMPSVDEADKNEIRNTIKKAAKLEFYLVADNDATLVQEYEADRQKFKTPAGLIRAEIEEERTDGSVNYIPVFLEENPTPVKGEDIERALATTDEFGGYAISLKFNASGTIAFREVTSKNVGRRLAIVLDGKVYSAPVLKTEIGNGQAEITGRFTLEEARRLASVIASGNVPVTVNIGSEFGTDPTLGADSVHRGIQAAIIGLVLVVLFMIWYYCVPGSIAVLALIVNTVLVLGTMSIFQATITMPGIAGMVLTIGMAVDANVIIFERIREELLMKVDVANAVKAGYGKAFWAIFDSNITTLCTCWFLFYCGTGSIKGFAVTLAFGILASMFTAIFMTHAIFDLIITKDVVKTLNMRLFNCITNKNFDIIGKRRITLTITTIFVILSLVIVGVRYKTMFGLDFAGGTSLSYECQGQEPQVEKIREFLKSAHYDEGVRVGYKSGQSGNKLLEIVIPSQDKASDSAAIDFTQFSESLDKAFPEVKINLKQTTAVGANVGSQFKVSAFKAAFWSIVAIIIYLAFRFEFTYGVAAVLAIIHDAVVSFGLYMLFGGQLTMTVVAAIMTIMGYSLNDTIVIFDRVREYKQEGKEPVYSTMINKAVNDCLSRTILTSLTTMLVVICLLVLGGGAVRDFALVMFFGVITGTYSSNFLAPLIINYYHKRNAREEREEVRALAKNNK